MSQIKKALDKARAERLGRDFSPEVREVRPAAPEARQVEVCYTRTRVVNVPAAELLRRRIVRVAGVVVIVLGLVTLVRGLFPDVLHRVFGHGPMAPPA